MDGYIKSDSMYEPSDLKSQKFTKIKETNKKKRKKKKNSDRKK